MGRCNHCGTWILFGGKRLGNLHFCSDACFQAGGALSEAHQLVAQLPDELVLKQVAAVHQGDCPKCGRPGPVDVHVSHRVWSAIHVTAWKSRPHMSCRVCGVKSQIADILYSMLLGWWGFPFGLVMTPVQIVRNILGMVRGPDPAGPSPQLEQMVRLDLMKRAAAIQATVQNAEVHPVYPNNSIGP
jgi:hypothetical protein